MKKLWDRYSYAIILFVLSILTSFILVLQQGEPEKDSLMKITINEGDSLWQIAEEFSNEHMLSSLEFIQWVEENNGISGDRIYPGDELVIPVVLKGGKETELASSYSE